MPISRVELSVGRTPDQKRQTERAVTAALVEYCKCAPENFHVAFANVSNSDWAVAGRPLGDPNP